MRALRRDPIVDRQSSEQRKKNEDQGRDRRKSAGRDERDPRLIAESGKLIDPGETHDLPPWVSMMSYRFCGRIFVLPHLPQNTALHAFV